MTLEEKVALYKSIGLEIDELELKRKALHLAILSEMSAPKMQVGEYRLSQYKRVSIKTTLEHARLFDATKMEETLDKDKLKEIFRSGVAVEGITEQTYVNITAPREAATSHPES